MQQEKNLSFFKKQLRFRTALLHVYLTQDEWVDTIEDMIINKESQLNPELYNQVKEFKTEDVNYDSVKERTMSSAVSEYFHSAFIYYRVLFGQATPDFWNACKIDEIVDKTSVMLPVVNDGCFSCTLGDSITYGMGFDKLKYEWYSDENEFEIVISSNKFRFCITFEEFLQRVPLDAKRNHHDIFVEIAQTSYLNDCLRNIVHTEYKAHVARITNTN